jgi:hypothetical protein
MAGPEHVVVYPELGHRRAVASTVPATSIPRTRTLGAQSEADDARQVRQASHHVPVTDMHDGDGNAHAAIVVHALTAVRADR